MVISRQRPKGNLVLDMYQGIDCMQYYHDWMTHRSRLLSLFFMIVRKCLHFHNILFNRNSLKYSAKTLYANNQITWSSKFYVTYPVIVLSIACKVYVVVVKTKIDISGGRPTVQTPDCLGFCPVCHHVVPVYCIQ